MILDLEDSVSAADKGIARQHALTALATPNTTSTARGLRINSVRTTDGLRDLLALTENNACPDVLLLPKIDSAAEVRLVADILQRASLETRLIPLIESARGIQALPEIAVCSDRVVGLLLGAADLAADLGCAADADNILAARVSLVGACAGAGAGIAAIDSPCFDIRDTEGLLREAAQAQRLGFTGKAAVHPAQIQPLQRMFSPTPEALAQARRVLAISELGVGQMEGRMIDEAHARRARRILAYVE